jgi:uncharacterized protein (TIGR02391 family)
MTFFAQDKLQGIAQALGDTGQGLTGSEIGYLLEHCKIYDTDPAASKWKRLYNAFANEQNSRGDRTRVIGFIRKAMKPARFSKEPSRFEPLRAHLNQALSFEGLAVNESGKLVSGIKVETLSEARRRADELRADLNQRGVHDDVLKCCREELLVDNYFHAVFEAVKSIATKVRIRTGLDDDGATLVDRAFGGDTPMLAINSMKSKSEKDEQKGFTNLLKGTFGMFRNPLAHEQKLNWIVEKEDAEDLLSLVSLIHRRIDLAIMPTRD